MTTEIGTAQDQDLQKLRTMLSSVLQNARGFEKKLGERMSSKDNLAKELSQSRLENNKLKAAQQKILQRMTEQSTELKAAQETAKAATHMQTKLAEMQATQKTQTTQLRQLREDALESQSIKKQMGAELEKSQQELQQLQQTQQTQQTDIESKIQDHLSVQENMKTQISQLEAELIKSKSEIQQFSTKQQELQKYVTQRQQTVQQLDELAEVMSSIERILGQGSTRTTATTPSLPQVQPGQQFGGNNLHKTYREARKYQKRLLNKLVKINRMEMSLL